MAFGRLFSKENTHRERDDPTVRTLHKVDAIGNNDSVRQQLACRYLFACCAHTHPFVPVASALRSRHSFDVDHLENGLLRHTAAQVILIKRLDRSFCKLDGHIFAHWSKKKHSRQKRAHLKNRVAN